ncbi:MULTISPECIES: DUF4136 domain-containing protein [unclassified Achromobacter]|uniref:DUF4136 domain-containing protein n=1 Tax=unclassified Achromobacter TaxID=2626865 RepID=UPI000B517BC0|nr:hypothetical protein CEY05_30145 [Achromobacter sp. HZ34]OWT68018.1 hypothetical protein CEY04_30050 [Achromobacter sp. HZ28]
MNRYLYSPLSRWVQACCLAMLALVLAGCATTDTVSARVTSFQHWPDNATGQTYRFVVANPTQENNLEYQSYQDMVRAGIGATGLVEAAKGVPARFNVSFTYGVVQTQVTVRRPYDPYFYGGYPGFYGPRGYWGGFGGYWGPDWVDVPTVAYRNTLTVVIRDSANGGAEVYRATAYSVSGSERLLQAMPYLVRAIFDQFPGNNGSERRVEFPVSR